MTLSILLICMLNLLSQSSSYSISINFGSTTTSTAKFPNAMILGTCTRSEHEEGDFHYNLKNHLSTRLLSNIDRSGFYKAAYNVGTNSSSEERVYVTSLCRGDLSIDLCNDCVNSAATLALQTCSTGYHLLFWYDHCVYRYSTGKRTFFGTANSSSQRTSWSSIDILHQITKPSRFDQVLATTLNELVAKASRSDKRFATKEAKVRGTNLTLYSLGQCVGGMSPDDCKLCLSTAVDDIILEGSQLGGRFLYPGCNIRYQLSPFYEATSSKLSNVGIVFLSEILALALGCLVVVAWGYYCFVRRRKIDEDEENVAGIQMNTQALQFDLITIQMATSMFSQDNKLGRGGFGEVFKGKLSNGKDIAVKRRSKSSGQGAQEFKNEVELVGKLQHRNLVRLLGFCLEEEESMLVYEYVPNKSLDYFLFDAKQREKLNWPTRSMIIRGIARGILYLQEDSRVRVIHRDLKAANILLDGHMNPKISDFGMAKRLGADDQTSGNTTRVVGTHGYMAPEYVMKGLYSTKSDVFSFGVLLLEILTGKRNFLGFQLADSAHTLGEYAWQMWNKDNGLELMDPLLKDSCNSIEFLRCIHVGLLCVQEEANKRPTMSSVVQMLTAESSTTCLSKPDRPAFFTGRSTAHRDQIGAQNWSATELTISDFGPR